MPTIISSIESARGCGYRKPGGKYLVSGWGPTIACGKLPIKLDTCPCCGLGLKPTRGWSWLDLRFIKQECAGPCQTCPIGEHRVTGPVGLIWIGETFYKTPADYLAEAERQGFSRRLHTIPKGFKLGETWVALAHRKAIPKPCECRSGGGQPLKACRHCSGTGTAYDRGIFHLWRPSGLDYVVTGEESTEELERFEERGFRLVKVVKAGQQDLLPAEPPKPVEPPQPVEPVKPQPKKKPTKGKRK